MSSQWRIDELETTSCNSLGLRLDGSIEIPFTVIVGEQRAPAALIMAGVHGDEYEGPAAIQDLALEIDPGSVRGSIIFVPFANPAAFATATRRHPADQGDLNRSFPGNPGGSATEKLANLLFHEFALSADCILSLHGWSKEAALLPYAEYPEDTTDAARTSREAAYATGFRYLHPYRWPAGVLGEATAAYGIPIVEAEVGGIGTITSDGQRLYRDAILRFLNYFQVLEYKATAPPEPVVIGHSDLRATHAGLFRSLVNVGEDVIAGQVLGTVRGLDGTCLQTVEASGSGKIGVLRMLASVNPNDLLFQLFRKRREA